MNTCAHCGKTFETYPSQARDYCGKECGYAARRKDEITSPYRMIYAPDHPITQGISPYTTEHRVILYDKIGPGAHPCHYCGKRVVWMPGDRTSPGALVADHKDRNSHNNADENLVPSCQSCNNRNRATGVKADEVFIVRPDGSRLRGERRTCTECGSEFVRRPDPRPGKGLTCSRPCAGKARMRARLTAEG